MQRRTLAAAATPLKDGGAVLDEEGFGPLVDFLRAGGLDGLLALGTTGEGILLGVDERKRVAELFVQGPLEVIVHAGAQTTAATVQLAEHAASTGAAGVAVIGPPYFQLDERALLAHFSAAARACAPLPFYVYEFERASGYAVPLPVLERLGQEAPNLAGLKVSDTPYEGFARYLGIGLDVSSARRLSLRVDWRKARSEPSRRLRPPFRSSSRRSTRAWLRSGRRSSATRAMQR